MADDVVSEVFGVGAVFDRAAGSGRVRHGLGSGGGVAGAEVLYGLNLGDAEEAPHELDVRELDAVGRPGHAGGEAVLVVSGRARHDDQGPAGFVGSEQHDVHFVASGVEHRRADPVRAVAVLGHDHEELLVGVDVSPDDVAVREPGVDVEAEVGWLVVC